MKQLGPNIRKYPGYLLCTTYLEFLPALNYPPLPKKKNEWKFEIFFTLIFIHTLTTEQDFEFLLQSGVSIVCSGSSIGLPISSLLRSVHKKMRHTKVCITLPRY